MQSGGGSYALGRVPSMTAPCRERARGTRMRAARGSRAWIHRAPARRPRVRLIRYAAMAAPLPVNLHEYEPLARSAISEMAWDYLAGGSGDERTLNWNRERLDATRLWPRVLRDVGRVDTRCRFLGMELAF